MEMTESTVGKRENAGYQEAFENILGIGENAGYQYFLPFPQRSQKLPFPGLLKVVTVW